MTSVFFVHTFLNFANSGLEDQEALWIQATLRASESFWRAGVFGVSLFFLISGYVVVLAATRENLFQFALRRGFRIFPLLAVAVMLEALFLLMSGKNQTLLEVLSRIFLVGDLTGVPPGLDGVEWTLRLEVTFYLAVAAWISIGRLAKLPILNFWLPILCLFAIAVLPGFPSDEWFTRGYFSIFFPLFLVGFSISQHYLGKFETYQTATIILLSVLTINFNIVRLRTDLVWMSAPISFAILIFLLSFVTRQAFRSSTTISLLAQMTYPIYLFHKFLIEPVRDELRKVLTGFSEKLDFPVIGLEGLPLLMALIGFFLGIYVLEKYLDQPIIRWSKRITSYSRLGASGPNR